MKKELSIFIVEDNLVYANILKKELSNYLPCTIDLFASGKDCMDNLYRIPDIVILDHKLGEMNGLEVMKEIREISQDVHIIFLSAQKKMSVAVEALKYGAYDYVEKDAGALKRVKLMVQRISQYCQLVNQKSKLNRFKVGFYVAVALYAMSMVYLYAGA